MEQPEGMRLCPTRPDGRVPLFAHTITEKTCAKRQDDNYHKCADCTHSTLAVKTLTPAPPPPLRRPGTTVPTAPDR